MSTYTIHPHERRHHGATEWTLRHPAISTVAALAAAVVAGVLVGILFSVLMSGTESAALHRAGGHALATVTQAQHAAVAAAAAVTATEPAVIKRIASTRSPARGGFAVGRSEGAGTGFIVVQSGTRASARGGFAGRSLGAGHIPGGALVRSTANGS
jgi:hypothetical protein